MSPPWCPGQRFRERMPEGEGGTAVHLTDEKTKGGRADATSVGPGPASDLLSSQAKGLGLFWKPRPGEHCSHLLGEGRPSLDILCLCGARPPASEALLGSLTEGLKTHALAPQPRSWGPSPTVGAGSLVGSWVGLLPGLPSSWAWVLCPRGRLSCQGGGTPEVGVPWHCHFPRRPANRIWAVQGQTAPFRLMGAGGPGKSRRQPEGHEAGGAGGWPWRARKQLGRKPSWEQVGHCLWPPSGLIEAALGLGPFLGKTAWQPLPTPPAWPCCQLPPSWAANGFCSPCPGPQPHLAHPVPALPLPHSPKRLHVPLKPRPCSLPHPLLAVPLAAQPSLL